MIHGDAPMNIMSEDVLQIYPDTCAIKSQQLILKDFGFHLTEDQLRNEALMYGWYNGGTSPEDVGKLLELHGIPVSQYENANIFNLVNELAQGHKVIVGVDSGELWGDNIFDKLFEDNEADHALIVSGVDTSDPNNVKVIVTDPGTGSLLKEYSMEEFVDAWEDSNCFMMATNTPVPEIFNPFNQLPGFDTSMSNLPMIGAMPYDIFYNDLAFLNYTNPIPDCIFDDFTSFVGGDIDTFSFESMNYFNSLIF
jgi:hypothetical protein